MAGLTATPIWSEQGLVSLAIALGAHRVPVWSGAEDVLAGAVALSAADTTQLRTLIREGHDPLGEAFCRLRSPTERRPHGATYTPEPIVTAMVAWARLKSDPRRVLHVGAGFG